jgi:signal transduction histidine kinase
VTIEPRLIDDSMVRITITDDGPGFESTELPNIFERFYKGSKGNFGLGLAISKNVIEKHNGKITAENSEYGALFQIDLPIA